VRRTQEHGCGGEDSPWALIMSATERKGWGVGEGNQKGKAKKGSDSKGGVAGEGLKEGEGRGCGSGE